MIGFRTRPDKRTKARKEIDDRLNSGTIGKHLCCLLCTPNAVTLVSQGTPVPSMCGTMFLPKGSPSSFESAVAKGNTCPLCVVSVVDHMKEKHSDYTG